MLVGERLRAIREAKKLSQGNIEERTGLLHCYTSRVENGHTVPAIETLEKLARAMDIQLYQLFFEADGKPEEFKLPNRASLKLSRKNAGIMSRLGSLIPRLNERDKTILVNLARKMATR